MKKLLCAKIYLKKNPQNNSVIEEVYRFDKNGKKYLFSKKEELDKSDIMWYNKAMLIPLLWFISKIIDVLATQILIKNGGFETNPLFEKIITESPYLVMIFIYFTTLVLYLFLRYFKQAIFKEILKLIVIMSFIVAIFNLVLSFL